MICWLFYFVFSLNKIKYKPSTEIPILVHARPSCSGLRFESSASRKSNNVSFVYRIVCTSLSEFDKDSEESTNFLVADDSCNASCDSA